MELLLDKLLSILKESPKYLLCIFLGASVFLFIDYAPIVKIRGQYKSYFYIALVFSFCGIIISVLFAFFAWIGKKNFHFFKRFSIKKRIRNLTPKEKAIINRYIKENTRVLSLNTASGITTELISAGIIYPSTQWLDVTWSDHNIVPWVWDYINKHPEYVTHDLPPESRKV